MTSACDPACTAQVQGKSPKNRFYDLPTVCELLTRTVGGHVLHLSLQSRPPVSPLRQREHSELNPD